MDEQAGDEQLYQLTGRGDEPAFEQLVMRHQHALYGYFLRRTGQPSLAEELTQEVFLRLWRHAPLYRARSKFQTYLYRVAHNMYIDYLRRSSARPRETSLDSEEGSGIERIAPDAGVPPDAAFDRDEVKARLHQALHKLPEREREVLLLVFDENLHYRECAEILRIPPGTVKSRVHTAVERLRRILDIGRRSS